METIGRDQTAAAIHHAGGRNCERIHVIERQGIQHSVRITQKRGIPTERQIPLAGGDEIVVGEYAAFGSSGGP